MSKLNRLHMRVLAVLLGSVALVGCKKKEEPAPPPVARTTPEIRLHSSSAWVSRRRKPASPSSSKMVGTRTPQRASSTRSTSRNWRDNARARPRPIVVLPAPIMPTRKTGGTNTVPAGPVAAAAHES